MTDADKGLALIALLVTPHVTPDRDGPEPWQLCRACAAARAAISPEGQRVLAAFLASVTGRPESVC